MDLMHVLIISTNRNQFPMPVIPLGACIVAESVQKAGHDVLLLDLMFERDPAMAIRQALDTFAPDLIGISVRNIDNNDMRSPSFFIRDIVPLAGILRRTTSAPIVLGGAAVSVMPEELLRYIGASWAVIGDGETVLPVLLEKLSANESPREIPGLAWIEEGVFTSNPPAPFTSTCSCRSPDYRRWINVNNYLTRLTAIPLQTKIGCHFKCVYCTYRKIEGDNYRLADPGEVVDAIMKLASAGLRHIEFVDNVFNSPYDHAFAIYASRLRTSDMGRVCRAWN